MKPRKMGLSFFVIALALLVAVSFVAISHLLIQSGKENPHSNMDVSAANQDDSEENHHSTETTASQAVKPENDEQRPEAELVGGKDGAYHTEIQIFHTAYDETGEITVQSAAGDKVVAPGTENQYDVYVRNVGEVPISYVLEAQSFVTVQVNGEAVQIPVDASFSTPKKRYLLGAEDHLMHLSGLDGVKDSAGLSPAHQAKYTLTWRWPFDGEDELDTMLGNLAAAGEELTVKVAFQVTASYDPNAVGGSPMTGDTATIGLWVALFVTSAFILMIVLFWRKREQDEENAQTHEEKNP